MYDTSDLSISILSNSNRENRSKKKKTICHNNSPQVRKEQKKKKTVNSSEIEALANMWLKMFNSVIESKSINKTQGHTKFANKNLS